MSNILQGKVVSIQDNFHVVINKGSNDGITENNKFLIYKLGDEIIDPDTKENLGTLEIICGEGIPEHIQERITTIISNKKTVTTSKQIIKTSGLGMFGGTTEEKYDPTVIREPFQNLTDDTTYYFKQIQ